MIYFTSDTHFFHKNIIGYCARPFGDVQHMNDIMVEKWNEKIDPIDTVYFLGDLSFSNEEKAVEIVTKLNGIKIWILGNHDKKLVKQETLRTLFSSIHEYFETKEHFVYQNDEGQILEFNQSLILFHYPIQSWNGKNFGSWHLHGHTHKAVHIDTDLRLDVGVDGHNFYPWSIDEIRDLFALRTVK
ncbi:MAG: hypothetical protein NUV80_06625 [Candidatus Berkelbacteria bacterium]|nr:hypothetical protein [Candidatus Berkelbacteria bacterium]